MKKIFLLLIPISFLNLIYSQSVEIKDDEATPNTLIQVNDEGSAGSITFPDATGISTTTNKLYNDGGALKWDGTTLATGSSLWTLNSGNIYRSSGNVGIGIANPTSKLHLYDNITSPLVLRIQNINNAGSSRIYFDGLNSNGAGISVFGSSDGSNSNILRIFNNRSSPQGTIDMIVDGNVEFKIDETGDVGIGTAYPSAKLDVRGDVRLGEAGAIFLEIREISGVTDVASGTSYTDKLPVGWTGVNTRVLTMELQSTSNSWFGVGLNNVSGQTVSYIMGDTNRNMIVTYPNEARFHGMNWRMMIMKMP